MNTNYHVLLLTKFVIYQTKFQKVRKNYCPLLLYISIVPLTELGILWFHNFKSEGLKTYCLSLNLGSATKSCVILGMFLTSMCLSLFEGNIYLKKLLWKLN